MCLARLGALPEEDKVMATTSYFEQELFPPGEDGRADRSKLGTKVEVQVSNFHGDHQVVLSVEPGYMHLTKKEAKELGEALISAAESIGYDNT